MSGTAKSRKAVGGYDMIFIMASCRGLIVLFFLPLCLYSLPDRRTNPFGETDDDCSTESDGNHFTPLSAT